jgi:hypothetical protein
VLDLCTLETTEKEITHRKVFAKIPTLIIQYDSYKITYHTILEKKAIEYTRVCIIIRVAPMAGGSDTLMLAGITTSVEKRKFKKL